jgi:hypothetical protein
MTRLWQLSDFAGAPDMVIIEMKPKLTREW